MRDIVLIYLWMIAPTVFFAVVFLMVVLKDGKVLEIN